MPLLTPSMVSNASILAPNTKMAIPMTSTYQLFRCALLLAIGLTGSLGIADVYRYQDANGNTQYSDQQQPAGQTMDMEQLNHQTNTFSTTADQQGIVDIQALSLPDDEQAVNAYSLNSTPDNTATPPEPAQLTEEHCQELYGLACDRVVNWRKYALEKCGHDKRCKEESFLERKYKPVPLSELRKVAHNASRKSNRQDRAIQQFLLVKYTNFCEEQALQACAGKGRSCMTQWENACNDPRSLGQFLDQYHFSDEQKVLVLNQAKALNKEANTEETQRFISNMLNLILTQMML